MIGVLRSWISSIAAITMLLTVAQFLTPEGTLRKISGFIGGLLLLAALLQPLRRADLDWLTMDLSDYGAAIGDRAEELSAAEKEAMSVIIAERTVAYISDKADALGIQVAVRVETEPGEDGVPLPASVELEGPWSAELSAWMEQELGIPAERQVWHEGKN